MFWSIPSTLLLSFFFLLSALLGAGASTLPAYVLPALSFSVLEGADPPQFPTLYLPHPTSRSGSMFGNLQSRDFAESRVKISIAF
jgi:hypothetical protein